MTEAIFPILCIQAMDQPVCRFRFVTPCAVPSPLTLLCLVVIAIIAFLFNALCSLFAFLFCNFFLASVSLIHLISKLLVVYIVN